MDSGFGWYEICDSFFKWLGVFNAKFILLEGQ